MNYELVTMINQGNPVWEASKKRLKENNGKVLSILPSQDFGKLIQDEKVDGLNLFDFLTKRSYDLEQFMYFNQAPVPSLSEIFMNGDFSISIIHEGDEIGTMALFPNTRRLVKNIQYKHTDNRKDMTEEYTIDGKLFSEIFYYNDKPQEVHFYNEKQVSIISYYFYDGKMEYVTLNDEQTGKVISSYANLEQLIAEQLSKILTIKDKVAISYLGMELFSLAKTTSYNTVYLNESPLDDNGNVKGNLLYILQDDIRYIHEVKMSLEYKQILIKKGVSISKVSVIKD